MNSLFLSLTGVLAPLWRRLGADPRALQLILDAKLKIGERTMNVMGKPQQKAGDYAWLMYFVMSLFGVILAAVYFLLDDKGTAVGVVYLITSVYLGFLLVTEMSENMFDLRDLTIILSRPVSDTTFSLSRALHILVFAAKFALLMLVPLGVALLFLASVWLALLYTFLSVLLVIITVTMTLGLYLTLLRRVPTARLRQVLSYFQIGLSILFFVGYQIPNFLNIMDIEVGQFTLVGTWWGFLWPALWLGGLWDVAVSGFGNSLSIAQGMLGVLAAAGGVWYYLNQSEGYGEHLMALHLSGSEPEVETRVVGTAPERRWSTAFRDWFSRRVTRPGVERASFAFNWSMMLRDLKFRQQVYPGLVLLPVAALFFVLRHFLESDNGSAPFSQTIILSVLYFFALLTVSPLAGARTSDAFRAAWVMQTTPLRETGALFYGQLMAVIGQFFLPIGLIVYLALLIVAGPGTLDDILLSAAVVLMASALFQLTERTLPFSLERAPGNFHAIGPMMLVVILSSLAGLAHWALTFLPYGVLGAAVVAWIVCWLTLRELRSGVAK